MQVEYGGWPRCYRLANEEIEMIATATFRYQAGASYPDCGSSVEVYTDPAILEVETLGPLTCIEPGQSVGHVEHWFLHKGIGVTNDDESIAKMVMPLAQSALIVSGR